MAQSEAYKGPLVVFTEEELERIRVLIIIQDNRTDYQKELDESILKKLEIATNTDPKFKEPMK